MNKPEFLGKGRIDSLREVYFDVSEQGKKLFLTLNYTPHNSEVINAWVKTNRCEFCSISTEQGRYFYSCALASFIQPEITKEPVLHQRFVLEFWT